MIVIKPGSRLPPPDSRHSQSSLLSLLPGLRWSRQSVWGNEVKVAESGQGRERRDPPLTGRGEEEIKNINYSTSWLSSLSNPSQCLSQWPGGWAVLLWLTSAPDSSLLLSLLLGNDRLEGARWKQSDVMSVLMTRWWWVTSPVYTPPHSVVMNH